MPRRIELRKFPFPYKCALTISNDAEYMDWGAFLEIHEYLNTERQTKLGEGLNLEMGDSFFFYTANPRMNISYFEGTSSKRSQYAPKMLELMKAGYLDVLHTYGDFDFVGGFKREMAEGALEELKANDIYVRVWTNHSTVNNLQNIGGKSGYYQHGDLPSSIAYHTDITTQYGIKYFNLDSNYTNEFGQDRKRVLKELAIETGHLLRKLPPLLARRNLPEVIRSLKFSEPLFGIDLLRDKRDVYTFKRFRFNRPLKFAPDSTTLRLQLSQENLRRLISLNGITVIYQHLGCLRSRDGVASRNEFPYFDQDSLEALHDLSVLNKSGDIFITTVSRLLNYHCTCSNLQWLYHIKGDNQIEVLIEKVRDGIYGDYIPKIEELQGITFYTPDPENTSIFIKRDGESIRIQDVELNSADYTGRRSISIKWTNLIYPF